MKYFKKWKTCFFTLCMIVGFGVPLACANEKSSGLIIFDLTGEAGNVFSFPKDKYANAVAVFNELNKGRGQNSSLFKGNVPDAISSAVGNRFLTQKGDTIQVRIYYKKRDEEKIPKILTDILREEKRFSQIRGDLGSVLEAVKKFKLKAKDDESNEGFISDSKSSSGPVEIIENLYIQQYKRSNIVASVENPAKAGDMISTGIILGPEEHWFLSADVVTKDISSLKHNSITGQVEQKEIPSSFYISGNWMLGDVLSDNQDWYKNIHVKAMVLFDKKPFDSFGLGLGYRVPEDLIEWDDNILGGFSVFGGYLLTKEHTIFGGESNGVWSLGVGYDLGVLSSWVGE